MPHPLAALPSHDPAGILRYRDRQYAADLIATALLHHDFFSWLHRHPAASSKDIAVRFSLQARPLDVLLTLCRANGFLTTGPDGRHRLTPLAETYLVEDSPWFLGPYYEPIRETPVGLGFRQVLATGKPANWQAKADAADWHESMKDPAFARSFTDLMNCRGMAFGQALAQALTPHLRGRSHLLDVAGGSGIYSSTMAATHPHLRATVLEQPPVDSIASKEIARHGLQDRISVLSGDMFTIDWPATDILLLSNVLHDWDEPEARQLLSKAARTLPPGGLLVIHDAFIHDAKDGPLPVAEYSALLMSITQGKCYSAAEYRALMDGREWTHGNYHDTIADRGFLTAVKK